MFCSQCGKEIADNSKFCPECGKAVNPIDYDSIDKAKKSTLKKAKELLKIDSSGSISKDKNFTIFPPRKVVIVIVVLIVIGIVGQSLEVDKFLNSLNVPNNCTELADNAIGKKVTNIFGAESRILDMKIKIAISEEPNNLLCIEEGRTERDTREFRLEYDGEFSSISTNN